jgi:hypothetical protein
MLAVTVRIFSSSSTCAMLRARQRDFEVTFDSFGQRALARFGIRDVITDVDLMLDSARPFLR